MPVRQGAGLHKRRRTATLDLSPLNHASPGGFRSGADLRRLLQAGNSGVGEAGSGCGARVPSRIRAETAGSAEGRRRAATRPGALDHAETRRRGENVPAAKPLCGWDTQDAEMSRSGATRHSFSAPPRLRVNQFDERLRREEPPLCAPCDLCAIPYLLLVGKEGGCQASLRAIFLRSCGSRYRFRSRMLCGVTSTSSSSWM